MVEGLLDERVKRKIVFLGTEYREALLEEMPAESLPQEFGGAGGPLPDMEAWVVAAFPDDAGPPVNTSFTILQGITTKEAT
jgi:hypothetical protein